MKVLKRGWILILLLQFTSCAELQQAINQLPSAGMSSDQIGNGLKEALTNGVTKQVSTMALKDGFYKNDLVKIVLPEALQKVDKALRSVGLSKVADQGLKILNRAAEDAVAEAIPIFVDAIKGITFSDAKGILLGNDQAATNFLQERTSTALYKKFNPIIKNSFQKVGATKIWSDIIIKYNALPLTNNINPDLTDYVTNESLKGVYKMVAVEEKDIRNNLNKRTSDLMKNVFALQDN